MFEDTGFDVEVEFDDGIDDHGMQRTSTIQAKAYLGEKTPEMRARAELTILTMERSRTVGSGEKMRLDQGNFSIGTRSHTKRA